MTAVMPAVSVPTHPLERTLWVQQRLRLLGKSFSSIARERGWNRMSVGDAMRRPSYPQEVAIAEALGMSVRELFPERYGVDGQRLHLVRGEHISTQASDAVSKTG
jgi:lambda repressor-like predicted transcriptional regulator